MERCVFCETGDESLVAGPNVVICKQCITSCINISLGVVALIEDPRVVKENESRCNFCNNLSGQVKPHFTKNNHTICTDCITLCLSSYLENRSCVKRNMQDQRVLYAF